MNLQLGFGIAGAGVGLLVGLIGGVLFLLPFGVIILRSLLLALLLGVVFFILHMVLKNLFPELLAMDGDGLSDDSGPRVDISIQDDDSVVDGSRAYSSRSGTPAASVNQVDMSGKSFHGDEDSSIMEELQDRIPAVIKSDGGGEASFNEDAFYAGISHLPDIGNFSSQFSADETEGVSGMNSMSQMEPDKRPGTSSNMDPALIAQAIRTALKKEEQ